VTDGTAAGTQTVPLPLDTLPFAQVLFALDADNVIFSCFRSEIGHELCRMNPTTQEVEVVRDIYPGPRDSIANLLRSEPGYAYFTADDGIHGRELWLLEGASEIIFRSQFEDSP
jgi:hypothetical protein